MSEIITRIPPSPTGHLHIGTARTALFNYLFAKHNGGKMIFRSEDTDRERSRPEFETEIIEGLKNLGLNWDNEEIYRQSERGAIYKSYLEKGIASGSFYISKEESKREPGTTIEVIRLKNPNKQITFNDEIRGEITFDTTELGDLVVARSIDDALYHLTVVVDDFEMGITHVLRGEDHISNTPRQILIQEAIGAPRPIYAHLPLILATDRSKMSKRHGAVAVEEYLAEGFTKEAIINYLALLGWNPGDDQEIFNLTELIEKFSLDKVHKSGAIFDRQKFLWINKEHLNKLPESEYFSMTKQALPDKTLTLKDYSDDRLKKLLPSIRERISLKTEITAAAIVGEYDFAFSAPEVTPELMKWKKDPDLSQTKVRLENITELLEKADFSSSESIKASIWDYVEKTGKGEVLWPMRVALTGLERSPDPFTVAYVIGKEDTLGRLKSACAKI